MRRLVTLSAAALSAAALIAPAVATIVPTALNALLSSAGSPVELRARLAVFARDSLATNRDGAGEAWYWIGRSYARGGRRDSAAIALRRAVDLRQAAEDYLAFADVVLPEEPVGPQAADPRSARALYAANTVTGLIGPALSALGGESDLVRSRLEARLAWAEFIRGHADSAATRFARCGALMALEPEWRYRQARARLASGDARSALRDLVPLAARSRLQDEEVVALLERAAQVAGAPAQGRVAAAAEIKAHDTREQALLAGWKATRVRFEAGDGFPLGGVALTPPLGTRARAAVVLVAPGDSLPLYDSLAAGLRDLGLAVMLLEPRGSGFSTGPDCPVPEAWAFREDEMSDQVAADVRRAMRALAHVATVDTTRLLVVGVEGTAPIATRAARDPGVSALLLVSPAVSPAERGAARAALAESGVPVFFQSALEEHFTSYDVCDALYPGANPRASRLVESRGGGQGAAQFRDDPELMPRFATWLAGAWTAPRPASATRPPARRRG